jgi:hypothetical protein
LVGVITIECSQLNGVKLNMRRHKLRNGVYLASDIQVKKV